MINEKSVKKYCCEDISLIENYNDAINSPEKWECHHRLEIQGELNFSVKDLEKNGFYWNRPACELIFLTQSEHRILHNINRECAPMLGKHHSEKTKQKISVSSKGKILSKDQKQKISNSSKGKRRNVGINNPNYGNHFSKPKFKWLTPEGEIKIMAVNVAKQHHPDWVLIE